MRLIDLEKERDLWSSRGYTLYSYDRGAMVRRTRNTPVWIHFGAGNLFRAFQAVIAEDLLEKGYSDTGVIAVSGTHSDMIDKCYRPFDDLHISVTLRKDGTMEKRVIGSVAESVKIEDMERLSEIFSAPSLQVVSFTITEKGYRVPENDPDLTASPSDAKSYMGRIASLLCTRYRNGAFPLTLCSHDNCSHNGDVLRRAMMTFAQAWGDDGFVRYLQENVSFPNSMIDRITPRPSADVTAVLREDGVEDIESFDPSYYMNCFVNTEETSYLVETDRFANGRPAWDKAGVIFTDEATVDKCEKMKVCTCLNPLHTTLAVFGCLLGYDRIWKEMEDEDLVRLIRRVGYEEGMPVVTDPGVLSPEEFLRTVLEVRLPNPFLPDAPQRIAMDTSQKLPIRFGETLKAWKARGRDLTELDCIPFVYAGWMRYLTGIDDNGDPFELPSDPILPSLRPMFTGRFETAFTAEELEPVLRMRNIFGVDLVEEGLSGKILALLNRMLQGPGCVRTILKEF
ncbi:MAG: mannitol dehydrogenase family protein [Oscillospiraceae bacterium]|nr:mannitol dehydrogenase family protein [Oscillospiraceae bacterium]